ncbi:MAG: hypothetical protein ACLQVI_09040 [Polyangiaceae bacterium]
MLEDLAMVVNKHPAGRRASPRRAIASLVLVSLFAWRMARADPIAEAPPVRIEAESSSASTASRLDVFLLLPHGVFEGATTSFWPLDEGKEHQT